MKRPLNEFLFLLVDDSAECRRSLSETLSELGIGNTISFESGKEAFDFFDEYSGTKDCFFLSDLNMDELDGEQLFRKVRKTKKGRHTYFFLLTSQSERAKIIDLIAAGVNQFVLKPVTENNIKRKLDFFIKLPA